MPAAVRSPISHRKLSKPVVLHQAIVPRLIKASAILLPYSPECVEVEFSGVRKEGRAYQRTLLSPP
jgi:hypothetical protein